LRGKRGKVNKRIDYKKALADFNEVIDSDCDLPPSRPDGEYTDFQKGVRTGMTFCRALIGAFIQEHTHCEGEQAKQEAPREKQEVEVFCGWGEADDVCINIHRTDRECEYFPNPHLVPLGWSAAEARAIAGQIIDAAERAEELDRAAEEYFENEQKKEEEGR
jgi:hypothetical protein